MQKPQDCYVEVAGINTRYWAEDGPGSPVILIHGLGGFIENWLPNIYALAAHHRVYAVDLPGHGRTASPPDWPYRVVDLACFVRDFMATLKIERAHLIGHSMGGATAARFAAMFPQELDKLVLVSSAGLGKGLTIRLGICTLPFVGEIFTYPGRFRAAQTVKILADSPIKMTKEETKEAVDLVYELIKLPGAHRAFLKTLRANADFWGQRSEMYEPIVAGLSSIINPALIVWGRQDRVVPVAHAQVAAGKLPNARVKIFEPCGHIPMIEQPDAFNEWVLEFLRNGD